VRIRVLSDLHLEVHPFDPPPAEADVVVLAGDIHNGAAAIEWAARAFSGPVLYVPGNHEYYGGEYHAVQGELRAASNARVRLLDCDEWRHGGVRFLGCALWADLSLLDDAARPAVMDRLRRRIPDYRVIRTGERKFQPEDSVALCHRHREWLAARLAEPHPGPTVVITHFVPHRGSIAPQFADDIANPVFVVPLDELMGRAALWIHGHTHNAFDYLAGGTRILANPRGYPHEHSGFDPALVIEVPR
jgi:predicted phosphodiesterase